MKNSMTFGRYTLEEVKEKQAKKRSGFDIIKKRQERLAKVRERKIIQDIKDAYDPAKSHKMPVVKSKGKKREKTQAHLKKDLDAIFSKYIRQKYPAECYTCNKKDTPLQCGHFVSRQYLATRWDENNCRPQCVGCNIYGNGKPLDFEERLKKELGAEFVEAMKATRHQTLKLDRNWYKERIDYYKGIVV